MFTIVVQNAVPIERLGVATSNLTFFQQVGGTVGLAIAGTIFGTVLREEVPRQLVAVGVPEPLIADVAGRGSLRTDDIAAVGDLGQAILAQVPEQFRALVEPLVPTLVGAIHQAFSIATASTFLLGVASAALAAVIVLFLREAPLRTTFGEVQPSPEAALTAEMAAD